MRFLSFCKIWSNNQIEGAEIMKIDRIRSRAKEMGLSLSFICSKLGLAKVYFNDVEKNGRDIPPSRLEAIAQLLQTNSDYLTGKSDIKEKAPDHNDQVPDKNVLRIAGRDGTYVERKLTDEQMRAFKLMVEQLPEADDL